ncbi:MAG TPA: PQQ-dependent sugar dehydrogenase [Myxococcota bacterium]|nr:PQQ-dependent sugar dehydrogenase [Myxococcota bacterium]
MSLGRRALSALALLAVALSQPISAEETPPRAARAGECKPLETREPNAPEQRPSFPGQTRACAVKSSVAFEVTVLTRELESPWAVEPLPDGRLLVTERPGRMRVVSAAGALGEPIAGLPEVDAGGQGGLLDVALGPTFASDRTIYWSYSEPRGEGNATSVARGALSEDGRRLDDVRVVFRAEPTYDGDKHFGSRLAFGPDGMLYVTLGERSDKPMRMQAQQLDSHMGKTVRIRPDGAAPPDNPFFGRAGAKPEIWTLGHRNVQAAAFDPQGRLWVVEHGTKGGDELNLVEKGKNYGWPLVAFGREYSLDPIPGAVTDRPDYEPPVYFWDPVIAPSGAQFYGGNAFPEWRGSLFVGGLMAHAVVRLVLEGDRVTGEEHLLEERGKRIRDVREGADGALYVVTDHPTGELWRVEAPR